RYAVGESVEDLAQVGNIGLIKACMSPTYNPDKGKFSTYAARSIRYAIDNYLQYVSNHYDGSRVVNSDVWDLGEVEEIPEPDSDPEANFIRQEQQELMRRIVNNFLKTLPAERNARYQLIIECLKGNIRQADIVKSTNQSAQVVSGKVSRAKKWLQK